MFGLRAVSSLALHVRCGSVLAATACRWEVCVREGVAAGSLAATARSARGPRGREETRCFLRGDALWLAGVERLVFFVFRSRDLRQSDEIG